MKLFNLISVLCLVTRTYAFYYAFTITNDGGEYPQVHGLLLTSSHPLGISIGSFYPNNDVEYISIPAFYDSNSFIQYPAGSFYFDEDSVDFIYSGANRYSCSWIGPSDTFMCPPPGITIADPAPNPPTRSTSTTTTITKTTTSTIPTTKTTTTTTKTTTSASSTPTYPSSSYGKKKGDGYKNYLCLTSVLIVSRVVSMVNVMVPLLLSLLQRIANKMSLARRMVKEQLVIAVPLMMIVMSLVSMASVGHHN